MKLLENVKKFIKDERGLETVEYAIMAALLAVGLIFTLGLLREQIVGVFNRLVTALTPTP